MSEKPSDHDFESAAERFLLADADVVADPFGMYDRLREKSPVHYVEGAGVWLVTRYETSARSPATPRSSPRARPPAPTATVVMRCCRS